MGINLMGKLHLNHWCTRLPLAKMCQFITFHCLFGQFMVLYFWRKKNKNPWPKLFWLSAVYSHVKDTQSREDCKLFARVIHSILSAPGDPLCSLVPSQHCSQTKISVTKSMSLQISSLGVRFCFFGSRKRRQASSWALRIFISSFSSGSAS